MNDVSLNNPGNIKKGTKPYVGEVEGSQADIELREFYNISYGYRALFIKIRESLALGNNTLERFTRRFYITTKRESDKLLRMLKSTTGKDNPDIIDFNDKELIIKITKAIAEFNNEIKFQNLDLGKIYESAGGNQYL